METRKLICLLGLVLLIPGGALLRNVIQRLLTKRVFVGSAVPGGVWPHFAPICGLERRIPLNLYVTNRNLSAHEYRLLIEMVMRTGKEVINISYFNDTAARALLSDTCGSEVLRAYDCIRPPAFKADLWRYCVLWGKGGVYLDAGDVITVPLQDLVAPCDTNVLVRDRCRPLLKRLPDQPDECKTGSVVQISFLAAAKGSALMRCAIDEIIRHVSGHMYFDDPLKPTGPLLLGKCLERMHADGTLGEDYRMDLYFDGDEHAIKREFDNKAVIKTKATCNPKGEGKDSCSAVEAQSGYIPSYASAWASRQMYSCPKRPHAAGGGANEKAGGRAATRKADRLSAIA